MVYISTEIRVENMDERSFASSKSSLKKVFKESLQVPDDMIVLQFDERSSKIMVNVVSKMQDFVMNRIQEPNFITNITAEKDKYPGLRNVKVPKQEALPVLKPVSGTLKR